ncbi:hypothetical protein [Methylophaga sp. UBA678]|uniref:hypothetical protein n=1 Tax=Methylophaga sp. UBA678 TaxID=1946901 RepID=UPI00259D2C43|nr:hypothetical protein [Methylophaga sp. UBA678]|tara:strand:+ start:4798 stop:5505 length:708 start_codon:yes stop_codon:yes gene_type:complete
MPLTILETFVQREPISQNQYRVFFRTQNGDRFSPVRAIDVSVITFHDEPYKLAELLAIKYVLLHKTYVGVNRTGKDLQLNVSSGAIRKAQKLHTTNSDMHLHARFLQTRFAEASIKVARRTDWITLFNGEVEDISPNDCLDPPIKTHIGDIHLTRHAVERFCERMSISSIDRAWRRLSKMLTSSNWTIKKPQRPLREGKPNRTTETWALIRDNTPAIDIVIVRNPKVSRVVTVIA